MFQKTRAVAHKYGAKAVAAKSALGAALLAGSIAVHAALPAAVDTAVDNAESDMTDLLTKLIGAGAVLWVLNIIYRRFAIR